MNSVSSSCSPAKATSAADAAPPPQPFRASFARLDPASGRGSALPLLLPLNPNSSRFSHCDPRHDLLRKSNDRRKGAPISVLSKEARGEFGPG
jgi:hypothetical protein